MTVIAYTAKRRLQQTAFEVVGTDISFSSADNSINSSSTDLSGLLDGEWVRVVGSGSNDAVALEVTADSTANKILVDATMINESAGASVTLDGFYRGSGVPYSLETVAQQINLSVKSDSKRSISLSGNIETNLYNEKDLWSIITDHITEAELPQWLEFFSSVKAGESLSIDLYGTIVSPGESLVVTLEGDQGISRVGSSQRYTINFKVRVSS